MSRQIIRDSCVFFIIIGLFIIVLLSSCTIRKGLITEEIGADKIIGTFNLILYNNRFSGDVESLAILDIEGDKYTFEIFAPEFDYRVFPNMSAEDAKKKALSFIASYGAFKYPQISQIKDLEGKVIGYEFRPLYSSSEFGLFDVLEIDYWIIGNIVKVKIDLIPEVKRRLLNDDFPIADSQ